MISYDRNARHFLRDGAEITFSPDELQQINKMGWWQIIPFSPAVSSPGYHRCAELEEKYFLDKLILKGKSVLGIGCYEGFPLYLAEAMGASRIVGITDDFSLVPSINESRAFTHSKLGSKVEFLNIPFDEVTVNSVGQFDIVFFYDVLPHVTAPFDALKRVSAIAKTAIFITSPFVLSEEDLCTCYRFENFSPSSNYRNKHGFTSSWILKELQALDLNCAPVKVWEHDYISLCAIKKQTPKQSIQILPSIEDLPDDTGMEDKTAVLVMSCKLYEQCWDPFFTLFKKYWPDCPYRVYLGTDSGSYPGVETISVGEDKHWASNILNILSKIDAERIILFQEDFFLFAPVKTDLLRKYVRHSLDRDIASLRLYWFPSPTSPWKHTSSLGIIGPFDDYRFTFQLTIWDKEFYSSLMMPGEDPWTTEYVAARRSVLRDRAFTGIWPKAPIPIPYLTFAVDKGEWTDEAFALLDKEGISRTEITRKIRSPLYK